MNEYNTQLDEGSLVLEIGSGSHPWKRSDVLLDRFYVDDAGQRGGGKLFVDKRPMIVAAGEHLPFKDKAFDFVFCCHVIEHAEDLSSMLDEMSRVGKAGYLECPNPILERVLDQAQHNWYITNVNGKLLIARKTPSNNVTTAIDRFYFHMMSDHFIIRGHWEHFVTRLAWSERIDYEICNDVTRVFANHFINPAISEIIEKKLESVLRRAWKDAVKEQLRRRIRTAKLSGPISKFYRFARKQQIGVKKPRLSWKELQTLLACPYCHFNLVDSQDTFTCTGCNRVYPRVHGIPVFL